MSRLDPAFHKWQQKVGERSTKKAFKSLGRPGAGTDIKFKPDGGADKSPAHHLAASYKMSAKKVAREVKAQRQDKKRKK